EDAHRREPHEERGRGGPEQACDDAGRARHEPSDRAGDDRDERGEDAAVPEGSEEDGGDAHAGVPFSWRRSMARSASASDGCPSTGCAAASSGSKRVTPRSAASSALALCTAASAAFRRLSGASVSTAHTTNPTSVAMTATHHGATRKSRIPPDATAVQP